MNLNKKKKKWLKIMLIYKNRSNYNKNNMKNKIKSNNKATMKEYNYYNKMNKN